MIDFEQRCNRSSLNNEREIHWVSFCESSLELHKLKILMKVIPHSVGLTTHWHLFVFFRGIGDPAWSQGNSPQCRAYRAANGPEGKEDKGKNHFPKGTGLTCFGEVFIKGIHTPSGFRVGQALKTHSTA